MAAQASWGLGPPPGPLRFLVFVSPRSLAAERGPGRPQTERSITLGLGTYSAPTPSITEPTTDSDRSFVPTVHVLHSCAVSLPTWSVLS